MAETRSVVTTVSVVVAVICAGWAIYANKHAGKAAGFGPPGMGAPSAADSGGKRGSPTPRGASAAAARGEGGPPVAVVTQSVRSQMLSSDLRALGTARANESVDITSKTSNIVTAVRFRDSARVTRGAILVELDSAQARADLAVAQANLTESLSQYNRSRELLSTQALSKSQFEQLEATKNANTARVAAARAKLEDTVIRAPFSGRVGLRRISVGSLINPGAVITTLDDTSVIKVDFAVPENKIATLREGLSIVAQTNAYTNRRFAGRVASVDSRVDATTRAITVRADVPNADGALKPGMFINIDLARDSRQALVIPEEALVPEQSNQFVFVVVGGKVSKRLVQIGARQPGFVEVVSGLVLGDAVIVEGTQKVREGIAVRAESVSAAHVAVAP